MNGGFVTLTEMLNAIRNGWAAGISLARPVAAEPGPFKFHYSSLQIFFQKFLK